MLPSSSRAVTDPGGTAPDPVVATPAAPAPPAGTRSGWTSALLRRGGAELALQVGAAGLSIVFLLLILGALDYPVVGSFQAIWNGALATSKGIEASLMQAVPITLAGAGVWFAYKVGLFNIGADGQLQVGGIASFVVVSEGPDLPGPLLIALALVVGCGAGALWALIAGWLRVARGASEIISTIMLNFIAFSIGDRLISGALAAPTATSPQTAAIPARAELGLVHARVPVGWAFVIAAAVTAGLVVLMQRTGLGLRLRAIGLNSAAAERAGLQVGRLRLLSMGLSGAVAGLAGGLVVIGLRHYLAPGWAPAWGFVGILVAFLALRVPALIPVWGVIFGALATSAPVLKAQASVPDGIVTVMQVLPVLSLFLLYRGRAVVTRLLARRGGLAHG